MPISYNARILSNLSLGAPWWEVCVHMCLICVSQMSPPKGRGDMRGFFFQKNFSVTHTEWQLVSRNIKKLANNFITWCFIATAIHLYKLTALFCMAEKGFYTWQAAHNILRIIKVSCSCCIMHIIMARGFTLMCLGGGYYFRMCIHIWMEFEFFHPDQNDIHRKKRSLDHHPSKFFVIKWWEEKLSSNSAGIFETDLEERNFFFLTSWLCIYKVELFIFRWVIWAPCPP